MRRSIVNGLGGIIIGGVIVVTIFPCHHAFDTIDERYIARVIIFTFLEPTVLGAISPIVFPFKAITTCIVKPPNAIQAVIHREGIRLLG